MAINEPLVPDRLYTLSEACDFLRISEATARRWIKQHRLSARKLGRDYRILGRELLDILEADRSLDEGVLIFTPNHPLLKLAGLADSGHTDIAEEHDRYLSEWLDERE